MDTGKEKVDWSQETATVLGRIKKVLLKELQMLLEMNINLMIKLKLNLLKVLMMLKCKIKK